MIYPAEPHPHKIRARAAVRMAIQHGRLRLKPCEICGLPPRVVNGKQRIQAHHKSYEPGQWLNVVFCCQRDHAAVEGRVLVSTCSEGECRAKTSAAAS